MLEIGVDKQQPIIAAYGLGQSELYQIVVNVDDHQQCRVMAELPNSGRLCAPIHQHAEATHQGIGPLRGLHLFSVGVDPGEVFDAKFLDKLSSQEAIATQYRIFVAQAGELLHKSNERFIFLLQGPIHPTDVVILAVRVVVALLGATHFITGQHHRGTLREQQGCQHVADLAGAQSVDRGVVGGSFGAAIPGAIVGGAVLVVFAVGFVVLFVVGHHVVEREAVVRGDEIYAGPRPAALMIEIVTGSAEPRCDFRRRSVPFPKRANGIAKLVIPFAPSWRKCTDLVAARPAIPGLGD